MKTEDILKLIDAGFTKDEILKLDVEPEPQKAEPEPQKADPEPQKADPEPQKADPEPQKAEPQKAEPQPDTLKFIAEQFEKMTKAIQESNIINSDTKLKNEDIKTGPEILAEVIAPPERKRGKTK